MVDVGTQSYSIKSLIVTHLLNEQGDIPLQPLVGSCVLQTILLPINGNCHGGD